MELKNIEAFLTIAKTSSFSLAAKKLNINQSAISARIKQLESELNVELFKRNLGKKVELTREAELIYPLLEEAKKLIDTSVKLVRKRAKEKEYKISFPAHMSEHLLPPLSKAIFQAFPQHNISLKILYSHKAVESVRGGKTNICFAYLSTPPKDRDIGLIHLTDTPTAVVCSAKFQSENRSRPLTPRDLINQRILIYGRALLTYRILDLFLEEHNVVENIQMTEVPNFAQIKRLLEEQGGLSILQKVVVSDELKKGTLVELPFTPELPKTPVYILYQPNTPEEILEITVQTAKEVFDV